MKNLKTIFASFEEKAKSAKVQRVLLTGATAFALTPVALASEGSTGSSGSGGMSAVLGAFDCGQPDEQGMGADDQQPAADAVPGGWPADDRRACISPDQESGEGIRPKSGAWEVPRPVIVGGRKMNEGYFVNWLGSVLSLFNMTLNRILGFVPSRLYVGTLVFLTMFSLLAHLIRQGRKGKL